MILSNNATSETSGGKAAIFSRTAASLEAEFSRSSRALASSSGYKYIQGFHIQIQTIYKKKFFIK